MCLWGRQALNGFCGVAILSAAVNILPITARAVIYGKYFSLKTDGIAEEKFFGDNSYYVYNPPRNLNSGKTNPYSLTQPDPAEHYQPLAPTVVHFYGCGWRNCGGPWDTPGPTVGELLKNGIAVVSVGYRRITTNYWFDGIMGARSPEELIHVDGEGRLTLDGQGKTFSDYKVRICRHEFIVKSLYDGKMAMEHLVANAFSDGLDLNRMVFWAYSAGGSLAQYLTHIHHQWNVGLYTPMGMFYRSSMLDLPTANVLNQVWYDIMSSTRDTYATKLKDLIKRDDCWWVVGSGCDDPRFEKYLEPGMPYKLCNSTWNNARVREFCDEGYDHISLGDLVMNDRWPKDDPEVGAGMEKIWYNSRNIGAHTPKPFYVFLLNLEWEDYGLLHSSLFVPAFKRAYHEAGVYYTAYYDSHPLMKDFNDTDGVIRDVVIGDNHVLKYQSNHGWRDLLSSAGIKATGDLVEFIAYACFVLSQPGCSPQLQKDSRRLAANEAESVPAKSLPVFYG